MKRWHITRTAKIAVIASTLSVLLQFGCATGPAIKVSKPTDPCAMATKITFMDPPIKVAPEVWEEITINKGVCHEAVCLGTASSPIKVDAVADAKAIVFDHFREVYDVEGSKFHYNLLEISAALTEFLSDRKDGDTLCYSHTVLGRYDESKAIEAILKNVTANNIEPADSLLSPEKPDSGKFVLGLRLLIEAHKVLSEGIDDYLDDELLRFTREQVVADIYSVLESCQINKKKGESPITFSCNYFKPIPLEVTGKYQWKGKNPTVDGLVMTYSGDGLGGPDVKVTMRGGVARYVLTKKPSKSETEVIVRPYLCEALLSDIKPDAMSDDKAKNTLIGIREAIEQFEKKSEVKFEIKGSGVGYLFDVNNICLMEKIKEKVCDACGKECFFLPISSKKCALKRFRIIVNSKDITDQVEPEFRIGTNCEATVIVEVYNKDKNHVGTWTFGPETGIGWSLEEAICQNDEEKARSAIEGIEESLLKFLKDQINCRK